MDKKQELIKQLIIFSCILVLVIVGAVLINSKSNTNRINTNIINRNTNITVEEQEESITDNLKGLLEEPTNTIDKEQEKLIKEMIDATSNNGIPTTVEDWYKWQKIILKNIFIYQQKIEQ